MNNNAHVERMVFEIYGLKGKMEALGRFLEKQEELPAKTISEDEYNDLKEQYECMLMYHKVLDRRISKAMPGNKDEVRLSYGMKLVALDFNPSGSAIIGELKTLFARAADILEADMHNRASAEGGPNVTMIQSELHSAAQAQVKIAQMMTVAVVTNKH